MITGILTSVGLFIGLVIGLKIGQALGKRLRRDRDPGDADSGFAAADSVVFAVLGLLIAFTFTTSASRFDERRRLIVQQANALGTANLRLDVLLPDDRAAIRSRMRDWLDVALTTSQFVQDPAKLNAALAEADRAQNDVWGLTVAAAERKQQPELVAFVLAPQNDWIDLTTTRLAVSNLGSPPMVLPTVSLLALLASVLAGFNMPQRTAGRPLHMLAFAGAIALSIYIIMDLDEPRTGLINVNAIDQTMIELRKNIDRSLSTN